MKLKIFLFIALLYLTTAIADGEVLVTLNPGKNVVLIDDYFQMISASELVKKYPEIESITLEKYGEQLGFINIFGGIGADFLITSGTEYEIYSSSIIEVYLSS